MSAMVETAVMGSVGYVAPEDFPAKALSVSKAIAGRLVLPAHKAPGVRRAKLARCRGTSGKARS